MGVLEQAQHRAKAWTDGFLAARGCSRTTRRLVFHYVAALMEQLKAMLPITLLQARTLQEPMSIAAAAAARPQQRLSSSSWGRAISPLAGAEQQLGAVAHRWGCAH